MSDLIKNKFVDYLFQLYRGEIPIILKDEVEKIEGNYVWLKPKEGRLCRVLMLKQKPWDNMAPLGFCLFGMYWAELLSGVEKIIKKRWKNEKQNV